MHAEDQLAAQFYGYGTVSGGEESSGGSSEGDKVD